MNAIGRMTRLGAILTLLLPSLGQAQSSTSFSYDPMGRLTATADGTGIKSTYTLDPASNRRDVIVRRQFDRMWEAENLPHIVGYADRNGWAANVNTASGHMTYGPYVTDIATGARVATWRMAIDVRNASNDQIVTLDVYDSTAGEQLASRSISRLEWSADQSFQVFELPFIMAASRAGHALEFRTYYHGNSYILVDKIGIY